jgi:hypothetical protein
LSALLHEQLTDIAEFDQAEAWRGDAATSMVAWLTDRCRVSASTARQWVKPAARLEALPSLSAALAAGDLSLDVVGPLAEVATTENEAELRAASAHWSARQVRELVEWHKATEEALAGAAVREFDHRALRFNDAKRTMWVAFTRDEYALTKSALVGWVSKADVERRRTRSKGSVGSGASVPHVPYDQRLYDALVALIRAGGEATDTEDGAGGGRRRSGAGFRPRLVVHAPIEVLLGIGGGASGGAPAEIEGVGPVSAEVLRRLACDAHIDLQVESHNGSVLDQGRARREPTTAQRTEIARRDKGCRFPSCGFCEFIDIHHMNHWAHGGTTDLANLITLCGRHHNAVHELGWTMTGDANGVVTFTSPQGHMMTSAPSPTWGMPLRR